MPIWTRRATHWPPRRRCRSDLGGQLVTDRRHVTEQAHPVVQPEVLHGVPDGHGHSYGAATVPAWAEIVQPDGWTPERTADLTAIMEGLRRGVP